MTTPPEKEEILTSSTSYSPERDNEDSILFRTVPPLREQIEEILIQEMEGTTGYDEVLLEKASDRLTTLISHLLEEERGKLAGTNRETLVNIHRRVKHMFGAWAHPNGVTNKDERRGAKMAIRDVIVVLEEKLTSLTQSKKEL